MFIEGERKEGRKIRDEIDLNQLNQLVYSTNEFFVTLAWLRSLIDSTTGSLDLKLLKEIFSKLEELKTNWGKVQGRLDDIQKQLNQLYKENPRTAKYFYEIYFQALRSVLFPELPSHMQKELNELRIRQANEFRLEKNDRERLLILQAIKDLVTKLNIPYGLAKLLVDARELLFELWNKQPPLSTEEAEIKILIEPFMKEVLKDLVLDLRALKSSPT